MQRLMEKRRAFSFFQIQFHAARMPPHCLHKTSRRINLARCANRNKDTAFIQSGFDTFHFQRDFAKPDNMGPQPPWCRTGRAGGMRAAWN